MPQKDKSDNYMISELGNWNVAARFSEEKVMKPLIKCDIYEDIARFGHHSMLEETENLEEMPLPYLQITGLSRLLNELIKICKNTDFAMKKQGTQATLKEILKNLKSLKSKLNIAYKEDYNPTTKVNEIVLTSLFSLLVEKASDLKSQLNVPLNQNHLIFIDKDEFDPVAFKNRMKDRVVNKG